MFSLRKLQLPWSCTYGSLPPFFFLEYSVESKNQILLARVPCDVWVLLFTWKYIQGYMNLFQGLKNLFWAPCDPTQIPSGSVSLGVTPTYQWSSLCS